MNIGLGRVIGVCAVAFFFIKIYQHNKVIQATYTKQRLEKQKRLLANKIDALNVQLMTLKERSTMCAHARDLYKMVPVQLSNIVTLTSWQETLSQTSIQPTNKG